MKLALFDLDGTLFRGNAVIPYAIESVAKLRDAGVLVRFLTNNAGTHRSQLTEKLRSLGFEVEESEVYSSAMAAAQMCVEREFQKVFLVGEPGMSRTVADFGLTETESQPDAVIVGICRQISYPWIDQALQRILSGAAFIATNTDATYPLESGVQPGAGAIVAAVAACSGKSPEVAGKPERYVVDWILREAGCEPDQTWVIGDRMETDIEAGMRSGCQTHLVLTGVTAHPIDGVVCSEDLRGAVARIIG